MRFGPVPPAAPGAAARALLSRVAPPLGAALSVALASWSVAAHAQTFANPDPITIPSVGVADPWPSALLVSGITGPLAKVTVTLDGFTHVAPEDVAVLLVGPAGQSVALMFAAGQDAPASGVTLTFDDAAAQRVPIDGPLISGTFRPGNYSPGDVLDAPAPRGPYGTLLSSFAGTDPNGRWDLFVQDLNLNAGGGEIAGGWSLNLTTGLTAAAPEPASVGLLAGALAAAGAFAAGRLHRRRRRRSSGRL